MATRLSQKQVGEMFYRMCRNTGVPTEGEFTKAKKLKHGFFTVGGAYGMMRIEFVMKCGGIFDVSGFRGAREMQVWLQNFSPTQQYKYYRERENKFCKSMAQRPGCQG